jgi:hypothetical protein
LASVSPRVIIAAGVVQFHGTALFCRQEIKGMGYLMNPFERLKEQGKLACAE